MGRTLPYKMQLGSGTLDALPSISYLGSHGRWSWGTKATGTLRIGENCSNFTLGNRFDATGWGALNWADWLSTSVRFEGQFWGSIDGADPDLDPTITPFNDPDRQGGESVHALFGVNFYIPRGPKYVQGHKIAVEFGIPLYQSLDGPQLADNWRITFGWQYTLL